MRKAPVWCSVDLRDGNQALAEPMDLNDELEQKQDPSMNIRFEYSPEHFSATENDYTVRICSAVTEALHATKEKPVILNLPTQLMRLFVREYRDVTEPYALTSHTIEERGAGGHIRWFALPDPSVPTAESTSSPARALNRTCPLPRSRVF